LENIELSMKLMSKRKGLFSMTLNSGKKFMNKAHTFLIVFCSRRCACTFES